MEEIVFLREEPQLVILYHVVSSEIIYLQVILYGLIRSYLYTWEYVMYYIDCLFRNNMSISHNSFKSDNEFEREKGRYEEGVEENDVMIY